MDKNKLVNIVLALSAIGSVAFTITAIVERSYINAGGFAIMAALPALALVLINGKNA